MYIDGETQPAAGSSCACGQLEVLFFKSGCGGELFWGRISSFFSRPPTPLSLSSSDGNAAAAAAMGQNSARARAIILAPCSTLDPRMAVKKYKLELSIHVFDRFFGSGSASRRRDFDCGIPAPLLLPFSAASSSPIKVSLPTSDSLKNNRQNVQRDQPTIEP